MNRLLLPILMFIELLTLSTPIFSDDVWEYSPYRVKVWLSFDPKLFCEEVAQGEILRKFEQELEIAYGPTCDLMVERTPSPLNSPVLSGLDELNMKDLQAGDYVLVISKEHGGNIRSFQAAVEKIDTFSVSSNGIQELQSRLSEFSADENLTQLQAKLKAFDGDGLGLRTGLQKGDVQAAIVTRPEAEQIKGSVRLISVRFPWQVESVLRSTDKLVMAGIYAEGESYRVKLREFDCGMMLMGPVQSRNLDHWDLLPRMLHVAFQDAFTPIARIEQADAKVATLRVRASGLVLDEMHPALVHPGDVLMPMVRKSDRTGADATLQSIPWTYIAITHGDRINVHGAIFSGIRGALQGRQNKRVQRLASVVKLSSAHSEIELVSTGTVRSSNGELTAATSPVPGVAVYQRIPSQENMEMLGRSDWRGILPLPTMEKPEIEFERPKTVALATAEEASESTTKGGTAIATDSSGAADSSGATGSSDATNSSDATGSADSKSSSETSASTPQAQPSPSVPPSDLPSSSSKERVRLNVPLYLYYVKNGDTVLARLPVVHGISTRITADLPDDSRRLEAEALLRGLQGEIVDVVARRKILEMRIDARIKDGRTAEAKKLLEDLRRVPTYDKVNEKLDVIQRQILKPDKGPIPVGSRNRIDVMFDTTRQLMQKYLQTNLVRDFESRLESVP